MLMRLTVVTLLACCLQAALGQEARIHVRADQVTNAVTPYMTGACIEDVNHEIYGGIYSQMIFGESFAEPVSVQPPRGFTAYGGTWRVDDLGLYAAVGDGAKLMAPHPPFAAGEVTVELLMRGKTPGNAGLIVKVDQPGVGNNNFFGYEVSLDAQRNMLILGRHRNSWEHIRDVPCNVPVDQWITLTVRMSDSTMEILVDGESKLKYQDEDHPLRAGGVGLRTFQRDAHFRNLSIKTGGDGVKAYPFEAPLREWSHGVSGMWSALRRGTARGSFAIETDRPFVGQQSQRITFSDGEGEFGIENQGLNRQGMHLVSGKPYEGYLWVRAPKPTEFSVALESADGATTHAETKLTATSQDWQRLDFSLTPSARETSGRFAVKLKQPGTIILGHAFLQPGEWGRFKGLPVRKDVAEGLIKQGLTVMRLGGLMANASEYRWKDQIGPRDRRQPYKGWWYPYSSNGWGTFEFLDFCEAAGFLAIPDFNMDETPQDMAELVEYLNGPPTSEWGRRRAENGHEAPYGIKYLQLGNEEAVDGTYWQKFKPLAEAIWKRDPQIILIVGDFEYKQPIVDPYNFPGAPKITSLAAHKKILDLANANNRTVWFDVHIWNHDPRDPEAPIAALQTFIDQLAKLSPGADFKICVLEENATNHAVRRALAHARTINGLMRMGDQVQVVCAANALQPYKQNDNGWDQGLLFLTPSQVWGQPPYYVTQMVAKNDLPQAVEATAESPENALDVTALTSEDGHVLALQVVNLGDHKLSTEIHIDGFKAKAPLARVTELAGELDEVNTPENPCRVVSSQREWRWRSGDAGAGAGTKMAYEFPPRSFTIIRFEE